MGTGHCSGRLSAQDSSGKPEKEGHWLKNTEKADHAASCIEYFVLFPGSLESGRSRKAAEILSTRPWALMGGVFGACFGIRRASMPHRMPEISGVVHHSLTVNVSILSKIKF